MASGMGSDDPPPIPPPDFRKQTKEEFLKGQMPPLRGLMVDPKYPPTYSEAEHILSKGQTAQPPQTPQNGGSSGSSSHSAQDAPPAAPAAPSTTDVRRSSGASQIFSAAPTTNEVINTMPLGTRHTAGGETPQDASISTALATIKPRDYLSFHRQPCVRESLLQGIIASFLTGGTLFILGRPVPKAANWSVGVFVGTILAGHEYCQYQRRREKAGMKVAVEIIEEKKETRRREAEERRERYLKAKEERRRKEEVEARRLEEANKRWWRIWQGKGREGSG